MPPREIFPFHIEIFLIRIERLIQWKNRGGVRRHLEDPEENPGEDAPPVTVIAIQCSCR